MMSDNIDCLLCVIVKVVRFTAHMHCLFESFLFCEGCNTSISKLSIITITRHVEWQHRNNEQVLVRICQFSRVHCVVTY